VIQSAIRSKHTSVAFAFALLCGLTLTAQAKDFSGIGTKANYACQTGEAITIEGTSQVINLTGQCGSLVVSGVSAVVSVQQVESIALEGYSNQIRYGSNAAGTAPKIDISGVASTATPDAKLKIVAAAAESNVAASSKTPGLPISSVENCAATRTIEGVSNGQSIACSAGERILISGVSITTQVSGNCAAVCIDGASNTVTVAGDALSVFVEGTSNNVRAERIDAITVSGMSNQVSWRSSAYPKGPKISSEGLANSLSKRQ
jgi:Protein of unknown function (DUF3060)